MIVYRLWKASYNNRRFVDVWGVSRAELEKIPDIELVIGPTCAGYLSVMFRVNHQKATVDWLVEIGAVSYDTAVQMSH